MNYVELVQELKQRKIVQTLIVYVGGSWGILQVLSFFASTYNWPREVIDVSLFLLACGFVVAMTIAWFHGEKGVQKVTRFELTILASVTIVAIGGGWGLVRRDSAAAPDDAAPTSAAVAVLPFQNMTGDTSLTWLQHGLAEMFTTDLAQVPRLRVVSGLRVYDLLNQQGLAQSAAVPDPQAQELAREADAGYLLRGTVLRSGETLRVNVELVNAADGMIAVADHQDGPVSFPFPLVDSLAARLSARMLKSQAPGATPSAPLATVATANVEAYREYQDGLEAERQGLRSVATSHYRRAVALDSMFPQALLRLGMNEVRDRDLGSALHHLAAARQYAVNAPERDRLTVEGTLALLRRDTAQARQRFEVLTHRYPDDKEAWVTLGWTYGTAPGAAERRDSLLRQVLRLDPSYAPALSQLAEAYARRHEFARADSLVARYMRADPDQPRALNTRAHIRELATRYAEARQDYLAALQLRPDFTEAMTGLSSLAMRTGRIDECLADLAPYADSADPAVALAALRAMASLHVWRGEMAEALVSYRRAAAVAPRTGPGGPIQVLQDEAQLLLLEGAAGRAADLLAPAVRQGAPALVPWYALAVARAGRTALVQPALDSVRALVSSPELGGDRGILEEIEGEIAYYRGDWKQAVDRFAAARGLAGRARLRGWSALEPLALVHAGRAADALPLVAGMDSIPYGRPFALPDLYTYGRVQEANGRRADAIRGYERLLAAWGGHIRDLPDYRDAPERLVRLRGR